MVVWQAMLVLVLGSMVGLCEGFGRIRDLRMTIMVANAYVSKHNADDGDGEGFCSF